MVEAAAELFIVARASQAVAELQKLRMATQTAFGAITRFAELASAAVVGMGGAVWMATNMVKDWQKSLVNAAAIGGLTTDQMWQLADASTAAGRAIGVSSAEIAEGYLELTRAGFNDMNDIMEMNNVIMMAAVANQLSYAAAADTVVKSVKAFSISVEDTYEKVAVLQYIANQTQAEFGDFNSAMAYAGATSYFSGLQFEELAASVGVLSDIAMEAGIGARGLNMMMLDMVSDIPKMQSFMESFGLTVQVVAEDGTLNMTELIKAFGELDISMDVLQASAEQFNVRAMRAWLGLISHSERYVELLEGTSDASTYFMDTYMKQTQTLDFVLGQIKETFLSIFRNRDVVDTLVVFFHSLRGMLAEGGMNQIATLFKTFMEGAIANAPLIINLMQVVLETLNEISPAMIALARIMLSLNGGFLKLYITMSIMAPMWDLLVANLQFAYVGLTKYRMAKQQVIVAEKFHTTAVLQYADAQTIANFKQDLSIAKMQLWTFRIQTATMAISSLVGGLMSGVMAMEMWNSANTRSGKIIAGLIMLVSALTTAAATYAVVMAIAGKATWGPGVALAAGAVMAVGVLGASYWMSQEMRDQQEADRRAQEAAATQSMANWEAQAGVPVAHKGMWRTQGGPMMVSDDELILPPGPAEHLRRGGTISGGGGGSGISVYVQGNVYADDLKEILVEAMNEDYRRYAARRGDY